MSSEEAKLYKLEHYQQLRGQGAATVLGFGDPNVPLRNFTA